jgi:peptide/nickel transport system substrate-binding protein
VTFHNGKAFTADDVKFSVERLKNPDLASQYAPQVATVTSVDVLDPSHIQFNFSEPTPSIFAQLLLVPILTAEGIENIDTQPVGTGPFEFVEWIPNDHLTIKKFAGYWKEGLPRLDQIIFKPILDIDTRIANLEAGSVDLIQGVAPKDVERVSAIAGVKLLTTPPIPLYDVIQINTQKPPFDDVNVRRALCFAFDRASFANDIYYGLARASNSPYTPESWAYDSATEQDCQYDLATAAQALSDAGHPNGEGVSVEILSPLGYDELKQGGVLLQAALTELGVQASFVELELAAWIDRIAVNPDYDITMDVYEAVPADPALVFNSDLLNPETNISKYKNDEYASLVKAGSTTLNRAERQQIYAQLQEMMLKEVPVVFLAHHPIIWAAGDQVRDFQPNTMAIYGYNTTWKAK